MTGKKGNKGKTKKCEVVQKTGIPEVSESSKGEIIFCPNSTCAEGIYRWPESLGLRTIVNAVSILLIGYGLSSGNGFFIALIMFSLPLLFEIYRVQPVKRMRVIIRKIMRGIVICDLAVAILGLMNLLVTEGSGYSSTLHWTDKYIINISLSLNLGIVYVIICGPLFLLIIFDWIINDNVCEKSFVAYVSKQPE